MCTWTAGWTKPVLKVLRQGEFGARLLSRIVMSELNPYQAEAGPELDQMIHVRFMGESTPEFPPYSTDERIARRVLAKLKSETGKSVVTGQTSMRKKRWFARYESDPSDGTEVLAETLALAICRLALLRLTRES